VDNLASKRAAAQDARNIIGVWRVKNRLRAQPSELPSDSGIAAAVRDALLRDPFVERYEITPTANQGQVTLTGMVDTYFEKARAEDVVSQLEGVVDVNNNLTVADQNILTYDPYIDETYTYDYSWYDYRTNTTVSDWEIRQDIIDKLQWSPYIDSEQVTVAVENGIAILAGTVDTWSERSAATEHALQGGAIRVINKLTIEYGPDFELF
jgi:osmotically-inducible protein OsmY